MKVWLPCAGRRRRFGIGLSNQVLTVLCLMYLVMYIDRVNIATVAPRMTADLGLSNTQFGLAISAFSYPYALFQLIGGWVSDRFGPRRTLMLSGLVVCIATVCHRLGRRHGLADRGAGGAGLRRRLRLSHRDPRIVGLDAARALGIRAGHYPFRIAARKRC